MNDRAKRVKQLYFRLFNFETTKENKTSTLKMRERLGYPRLIMTLDKDNKVVEYKENVIVAPFTRTSFLGLISLIEKASELGDFEEFIDCLNNAWDNDKNERTDTLYLQGSVLVGQKNGVAYIGLTAPDKPVTKFRFGLDGVYHKPGNDKGENISAEMSRRHAKQMATVLNTMIAILEVNDATSYYEETKDK